MRAAAWQFSAALVAWALTVQAASAAPPKLETIIRIGESADKKLDTITVTGKWDRWPLTLAADGLGIRFEPLAAKGQFGIKIDAHAERGVRLVRLIDNSGASNPLPFIVPTTAETREVEPNDEPATAQRMTGHPIAINGQLQKPGDVDMFAMPLKRGQTLVADLVAHEVLGSPIDALLQVVEASGFVCAQNHDFHGLDPRLIFVAPRDGTYAVRLFAFTAEPNASINLSGGGAKAFYRLTLTTEGFVDYAFPLAVDHDKPADVQLLGWNIPARRRVLSLSPSPPGVDWHPWQPGLAGFGTIAVVDHPAIVEQDSGTAGAAQSVKLPVTVSGRIDPAADTDTYRFSVHKGQKLNFRLESRTLGFPLDGVLKLSDRQGRALLRVDDLKDQRDPTLKYTVAADGELDIAVSDLAALGGPRHAYRLDLEIERPEYRVSAASAAFELPAGKSVVVPITIERIAGFQEPIELKVLGLPSGISVAPLDKPAKDSKSMRLEFRAAAGAQSGTISILGSSAESGQAQRVSAPAGFADWKTINLWLTILPAAAPGK
ncbi:MAG TPA: PPC domain-containing protein [Pirellulales bacterium]|nr:PPC domain-containing protein [Pirellulales bacterium]